MNLKERIKKTEKDIEKYFENSKKIMLEKNRQRGDCWRNSGLLGQFIEIHSMYFRLRNLIWETKYERESDLPLWKEQVTNALEDLRNFTILAELCLAENEINFKGEEIEEL